MCFSHSLTKLAKDNPSEKVTGISCQLQHSQAAGVLGVLASQVDLGKAPTTSNKRGSEKLDYVFITLGSQHLSTLYVWGKMSRQMGDKASLHIMLPIF